MGPLPMLKTGYSWYCGDIMVTRPVHVNHSYLLVQFQEAICNGQSNGDRAWLANLIDNKLP